jgi:hypothetical protein
MIVNHVNPEVRRKAEDEAKKAGFKKIPSPISIGTVRYTSTARMHRGANAQFVECLDSTNRLFGKENRSPWNDKNWEV